MAFDIECRIDALQGIERQLHSLVDGQRQHLGEIHRDGDEHEVAGMRQLIATALAAEASPDRRAPFFLDEIDGLPVDESPLAEPLRAAGFARTPRGYMKRNA